MSDDGLDVVLTWLDENARSLVDQAHEDVAQAHAISGDLDSLEARIARMREELGADPDSAPLPLVGLPELQRPAPGVTATPEWEALRAQAEQSSRSRGVDPSTIDLDSLLDPEEVARIRDELGEKAEPAPLSLVGLPELQRPATGFAATPEWEALRAQAEQPLRSRGVDPSTIDLDSLLDPEEVARIARRFIGAFTVRTRLDRYDLAIMLIAGLTAGAVKG